MIQNVLRALGGIENYGILSICLFFTVFLAAMIFAATRKKSFCARMGSLPLDEEAKTGKESLHEE